MKFYSTALRITLIILFTGFSTTYAQRNYIYGAAQLPALAWVESALQSNEIDVGNNYRTDNAGLIFNLGYGINLNRFFVLETGLEYFIYGPSTEYYEYSSGRADYSDELDINHQAISLQLRPVFNVAIDEDVNLRFALAFNYQKIISNATYSIYEDTETEYKFKEKYRSRLKSDFAINLQPSAGIFFNLSERWTVGLDLSYIRVDWNKTLDYLKFSQVPNLAIPSDRTSTVYAAIKVLFQSPSSKRL